MFSARGMRFVVFREPRSGVRVPDAGGSAGRGRTTLVFIVHNSQLTIVHNSAIGNCPSIRNRGGGLETAAPVGPARRFIRLAPPGCSADIFANFVFFVAKTSHPLLFGIEPFFANFVFFVAKTSHPLLFGIEPFNLSTALHSDKVWSLPNDDL